MALTDNLISYYKMDEASGNRSDSHGSNTLTDNNTVGAGTGKINNGADFESDNSEYFSAASSSVFDFTTGSWAFAFWFKPEAWVHGDVFFSKRISATGQGYYILINNGKVYVSVAADGSNWHEWVGTTILSNGSWYHIVVNFDGSTKTPEIYINNGSDETTDAGSSGTITTLTSSATFYMGAENTPGQYLDGIMDEIGIWSRKLTSDERTQLYNSGNGFAYPFTSVNANFLAFMGPQPQV